MSKRGTKKYDFIGTGFFVGDDHRLLTAQHVFLNSPLSRNEVYAMIHTPSLKTYPLSKITYSKKYDIASAHAKGIDFSYEALAIAQKDPELNLDVLTMEFSKTSRKELPDGSTALNILASHQKGHVIARYYDDYQPHRPQVIELSFPALGGASGAPVITEKYGTVCGLIVANRGTEILPAQIVKTEDEDGSTEEIKYFLPNGLAIDWEHLISFPN